MFSFDFTYVFWAGVLTFLFSSLAIVLFRSATLDALFGLQVLAGGMMFVGSKIGREFLGLA